MIMMMQEAIKRDFYEVVDILLVKGFNLSIYLSKENTRLFQELHQYVNQVYLTIAIID